MLRKLIGALVLLSLTKSFAIKRDIKLVSFFKQWDTNPFNSVQLMLGTDSDTAVDFNVDMNYNSIIIFDKAFFTWGVECKAYCEVISDIEEKETYFSSVSTFKRIDTIIRPSKDELGEQQSVEKVPAKFMQTSRDWGLKNWGVVGIGPKSDFADYMRINFDGFY